MLITSGKSDYDVKPLKQLKFFLGGGGKMHILPPQSLFWGAAAPAAPHFSRPWLRTSNINVLCTTRHISLFCSGFKKRAPRAIKEIRKFAEKMMGTADVRIDTRLNKHMWSQGIRYDSITLHLASKLQCG